MQAWRPWVSFGTGKTYWSNSVTGEVQWERPSVVKGAILDEGPLDKSSLAEWEVGPDARPCLSSSCLLTPYGGRRRGCSDTDWIRGDGHILSWRAVPGLSHRKC